MITTLINTLTKKGCQIYTRPFELNIVGVRSTKAVQNSFDDTIHVFYKREDGQWLITSFKATTDPGTYWLKNPMNQKGTAILKPGQYKSSHRIGIHRGKYQALVQQSKLSVWRDNDRNETIDWPVKLEDTGIFGINIHRASINGITKSTDKHSAGCQVLASAEDFNLLMQLAFRHKKLYSNNFTYTLLDESDLSIK
jgi:hypothetical protein